MSARDPCDAVRRVLVGCSFGRVDNREASCHEFIEELISSILILSEASRRYRVSGQGSRLT